MKKRFLATFLVLCLVLELLINTSPVAKAVYDAQETLTGDFVVTGGASGVDYTYTDGVLSILSGTPLEISNQNPSQATTDTIFVANGVSADITLAGINIDVGDTGDYTFDDDYHVVLVQGKTALKIADDSSGNVKITLKKETDNYLRSGYYHAGIEKNGDTTTGMLTITGEGSLNASNSYGAAGIGGGRYKTTSNITIESGTITATAGNSVGYCYGGAGIGGSNGDGNNITIKGGIITAQGGYSGPGIGGDNSTITITGGTIKAVGGTSNAGIGGSNSSKSSQRVSITGGTIMASGGGPGPNKGAGAAIGWGGELAGAGKEIAGSDWNGIVFRKNEGSVYGNDVTIDTDVTIPDGYKLLVAEGKNITIAGNTTVTIPGKEGMVIDSNATVLNNGTIKIFDKDCLIGTVSGNRPVLVHGDPDLSGACGDALTWEVNGDVLIISGTGRMDNYYEDEAPWNKFRNSIKKIVIEEGVESVGDYAFWLCAPRVVSISFPASVTYIGNHALSDSIKSIYFKGNPPTFAPLAFARLFAVVCYPANSLATVWNEDVLQDYGGSIIWQQEIQNNGRIDLSDIWYFKNYQTSDITIEHYLNFYGIAVGSFLKMVKQFDGSGGHCYGMIATATCSYDKKPSAETYGDNKHILWDVELSDRSSDTQINARNFIAYGHIQQFGLKVATERLFNKNKLNLLYNAVESYVYNNGPAVLIGISGELGGEDRGHELLALSIEDYGNFCVIGVYDPNFPNVIRPLYLYKTNGHLTGWEYLLFKDTSWMSGGKYAAIEYCSADLDVYNTIKDKKHSLAAEQMVYTTSPSVEVCIEGEIAHATGNNSDSKYLLPIYSREVLENSDNTSDDGHYIYWVDSGDKLQFPNFDKHKEIAVVSGDGAISASATQNATITISAAAACKESSITIEPINSAEIKAAITCYKDDGHDNLKDIRLEVATDSEIGLVINDKLIVNGVTALTTRTDTDCITLSGLDKNYQYQINIDEETDKIVSVKADTTSDGNYNVTVYPVVPDYIITYSSNGGTGTMPPSTATENTPLAFPTCDFTAPEGKEFKAWQINGTEYAPGETYIFTADTTVYALWKDALATTYALNVTNGTGSGNYASGTQVSIRANAAPAGKVFDKWTSDDGGTFADASSACTTFTMPAGNVTVVATYKDAATPPTPGHTHNWAATWTTNTTHHWHDCTARDCNITSNHDKNGYGDHVYNDDMDATCNTCGYTRVVTPPVPEHTHNWSESWSNDATHHWHDCIANGCDITSSHDKNGYGEHVYDDDTDDTCNSCGYTRTVSPPVPEHTHNWSAAWSSDATHHWHDCTANGCDITNNSGKDGYGEHIYNHSSDATCNICGYIRDVAPSSDDTNYIAILKTDNGEIISSTRYAAQGERVTLSAHPAAGYELESVTVTDVRGRTVTVRKVSDNRYTFTMPATRVEVAATFIKTEADTTPKDDEVFTGLGTPGISGIVLNPAPLPFTDVQPQHWFYDNVDYVWKHYLMSGVSDTRFAPQLTTSRAMIWTILARMNNVRTDVNPGATWYERGMLWAMEQGVTDGTNPMGDITREQLAAMLWRNAGRPAPGDAADLTQFRDSNAVSGYAQTAVRWAVSVGILNGSNGEIDPQGTATRAQVVAMAARYGDRFA